MAREEGRETDGSGGSWLGPLSLRGHRGPEGRGREGRVRLGWRLALFVVLFLALAAAGIIAVAAAGLEPGFQAQSAVGLVAALGAGWVLLGIDGRGPGALGFYLAPTAVRESLLGLGLGVAVALGTVLLMWLPGGVEWVGEQGTPAGAVQAGLVVLAFFVLPAAAEEALLRGYPLQAMAEAWGPWVALVATSVVFGLLHLPNPSVTVLGIGSIVAAGLFLGVVYLRTGSLWWATAAHVGWNWAHAFVADLPVSGLERWDNPLWEGVSRGPAWLGGGEFGPEGSAVAVVVLLAATWLLWRRSWLEPSDAAVASEPLTPLPPRRGDERHESDIPDTPS